MTHRPFTGTWVRIALTLSVALASWQHAAVLAHPTSGASAPDLQAHASGVFLNQDGDVMTAYHAVRDCGAIYAVKDRRVVEAHLIAADAAQDLAVLATRLTPYLSATLVQSPVTGRPGQPVFVEAYNVLRRMPNRSSTVFNAVTSEDSGLSLLSSAQPGASGSPVLGSAGLMLGMVVERIAVDRRASGKVTLSRPAPSGDPQVATRVRAVGAQEIKGFLLDNGIPFQESDEPQLGALQAQAPRAATLSVGVICG